MQAFEIVVGLPMPLPILVRTVRTGMPVRRTWSMKFEPRSPRYTTRLTELPTIDAGSSAGSGIGRAGPSTEVA